MGNTEDQDVTQILDSSTISIENPVMSAKMRNFQDTLEEVKKWITFTNNPSGDREPQWNFYYLEPHYRMLQYYMSVVDEYLSIEQREELREIILEFESLEKKYALKYREP